MRFSVIIPVYNAKTYLESSVDSVLAQNLSDDEILLIDDGSTDGETPALCDALAQLHPERIRVIHQENGGPGKARNTGIQNAQGEYLVFLDSDDQLAPEALEKLARKVQETHADLIEMGFHVVREGQVLKTFLPTAPEDSVVALAEKPEIMLYATGAWVRAIRRAFLVETGFLFPERVLIAEDLRLMLRLLPQAKGITAVAEPLYLYEDRPGSIMRLGEASRNTQVLEAFQDVCDWYQKQGIWEQYRSELGMLCVEHLLLSASVRVLRADPKSPLLDEIQAYMNQQFPDYMENPYLAGLSKSRKLALHLIRNHRYGIVKTLFSVKDHLG